MREKLNNSPMAQVGLVAVLVVIGLVFFLKSSGGEEEEAASGPTAATVNGVAGSGDTAGEAVEDAIANLEATGAEAGISSEVPASVPAPPPPAEFSAAYDSGKTVVLLVVHDGGIDDEMTAEAAEAVAGRSDVAFFEVPVKQVPRYASITVGLDLNRVPALVVMRPRRLSGGEPEATVDYGYQTPQTVARAIRDASYRGPEETYHPD